MNDWKPNLFIPGFGKCGSTALCEYLAQHPDIYVLDIKEPNTLTIGNGLRLNRFWSTARSAEIMELHSKIFPVLPFEDYKEKFTRNKTKKYRVDASVTFTYVYSNVDIPYIIKRFSSNAKIIMIIRNLPERLISTYAFDFTRAAIQKLDFKTFVENVRPFIKEFCFYEYIQEFYNYFDSDMIVVDNALLKNNPQYTMNKIFDFLGIERVTINPLISNPNTMTGNNLVDNFIYFNSKIALKLHNKIKRRILNSSLSIIYPYLSSLYNIYYSSLPRYLSHKFKRRNLYDKFYTQIPEDILKLLEDDYRKTLEFCENHSILVK